MSKMVRSSLEYNNAALVVSLFSDPIESVYSLSALESKLVAYVNDADASKQPFDSSTVPKISRKQAAQEAARE